MSSVERRPSVAYYLTFAAALVGIVVLTIALDGEHLAASGGNPKDAIDGLGFDAFIFIWLVLYYQRLAFWTRIAPARQAAVTLSLRVLLIAEVVAAVVGSVYVFTSPAATGGTQVFMTLADLLQIGTVLWIVRYSRE